MKETVFIAKDEDGSITLWNAEKDMPSYDEEDKKWIDPPGLMIFDEEDCRLAEPVRALASYNDLSITEFDGLVEKSCCEKMELEIPEFIRNDDPDEEKWEMGV